MALLVGMPIHWPRTADVALRIAQTNRQSMNSARPLKNMVRSGQLIVLQNKKYDLLPVDKGLEISAEEAEAALG